MQSDFEIIKDGNEWSFYGTAIDERFEIPYGVNIFIKGNVYIKDCLFVFHDILWPYVIKTRFWITDSAKGTITGSRFETLNAECLMVKNN